MDRTWKVAHLSEIPSPVEPEPGFYQWKPIRHHFDVRSFGINAMMAHNAGDWVVEEHTETGDSTSRHEELYLVVEGHAKFKVGEDEIDAKAGRIVFVPDPRMVRSAKAVVAPTTVLAVGGEPGAAYQVSPWEKKYF